MGFGVALSLRLIVHVNNLLLRFRNTVDVFDGEEHHVVVKYTVSVVLD